MQVRDKDDDAKSSREGKTYGKRRLGEKHDHMERSTEGGGIRDRSNSLLLWFGRQAHELDWKRRSVGAIASTNEGAGNIGRTYRDYKERQGRRTWSG